MLNKFQFINPILFAKITIMKQPNVAGKFYPQNKNELQKTIDGYLKKVPATNNAKKPWGIIVPHAGYVYSGQTAAYAYKLLENKKYSTVIVLAPSHYQAFNKIALLKEDYQTPLGTVSVNQELAAEILKNNPLVTEHPAAFEQEHSLEVQLPFLQTVLKNDFKLLPLLIGTLNKENLIALTKTILQLLEQQDVLVVASSDLAHFNSGAVNDEMDQVAQGYIKEHDFAGLLTACELKECELCGLGPVITLMIMAKARNSAVTLLNHSNSGQITGDYLSVVGYLAAAYF